MANAHVHISTPNADQKIITSIELAWFNCSLISWSRQKSIWKVKKNHSENSHLINSLWVLVEGDGAFTLIESTTNCSLTFPMESHQLHIKNVKLNKLKRF